MLALLHGRTGYLNIFIIDFRIHRLRTGRFGGAESLNILGRGELLRCNCFDGGGVACMISHQCLGGGSLTWCKSSFEQPEEKHSKSPNVFKQDAARGTNPAAEN